jgi:membrane associated rhomboid family serine protease
MRRTWLVSVILWINIAVFLAWSWGGESHIEFMADNFVVSFEALSEGRYWTLLTSVFSHNFFFHLLLNMIVLRSFGSLLEEVLGPKLFLKVYVSAGMAGSLVHCMVSAFVLNAPDQGAVGASGALAGLVLLFSLLFPREKILLFALIPVPALFGALIFIGLDIWGLVAQAEGGGLPIGHGAHLGGAALGIYWGVRLRRLLRK